VTKTWLRDLTELHMLAAAMWVMAPLPAAGALAMAAAGRVQYGGTNAAENNTVHQAASTAASGGSPGVHSEGSWKYWQQVGVRITQRRHECSCDPVPPIQRSSCIVALILVTATGKVCHASSSTANVSVALLGRRR
jgi:hypothetical protein